MMGVVIGDMIGSTREFDNVKRRDVVLFEEDSTFTDDTVLTCATAKAIMDQVPYQVLYTWFFRQFLSLNCNGPGKVGIGYGPDFAAWAERPYHLQQPYGSWGNGSAMRVSPVAWAHDDMASVILEAQRSAQCTHSHPQGIRGAVAVAGAIFIARMGGDKVMMKRFVTQYCGYNVNLDLDHLNQKYRFKVACHESVPEALACFLQAETFEEAMRNTLHIGGDNDTIAAIVGSISEAYWGVPEALYQEAERRLQAWAPLLLETIQAFEQRYPVQRHDRVDDIHLWWETLKVGAC